MQYVALLRGINVGGRNLLSMAEVRVCLERHAFRRVSSYIQSGNILFESDVSDAATLTAAIQKALSAAFDHDSQVFLRSHRQLKTIVAQAPKEWTSGAGLRCNVAFLREPLTSTRALREIEPRAGVDFVTAGQGVLYLSTLMRRLKQSGFTKVVKKDIYRDMTIRNFNTCQKILALMQARMQERGHA